MIWFGNNFSHFSVCSVKVKWVRIYSNVQETAIVPFFHLLKTLFGITFYFCACSDVPVAHLLRYRRWVSVHTFIKSVMFSLDESIFQCQKVNVLFCVMVYIFFHLFIILSVAMQCRLQWQTLTFSVSLFSFSLSSHALLAFGVSPEHTQGKKFKKVDLYKCKVLYECGD